jgi:hypothetical protein
MKKRPYGIVVRINIHASDGCVRFSDARKARNKKKMRINELIRRIKTTDASISSEISKFANR